MTKGNKVPVRPADKYTAYKWYVSKDDEEDNGDFGLHYDPEESNVIHIEGKDAIIRFLDAIKASKAYAKWQKEKMENYPPLRELHTPEEIRRYFDKGPNTGSPADLAKPSSTCEDKIEGYGDSISAVLGVANNCCVSPKEIEAGLARMDEAKKKNKRFFDMVDNGILPPLDSIPFYRDPSEGLENFSKNGKNW